MAMLLRTSLTIMRPPTLKGEIPVRRTKILRMVNPLLLKRQNLHHYEGLRD